MVEETEKGSLKQENLVYQGQIWAWAVTLGPVKLPIYESMPYV